MNEHIFGEKREVSLPLKLKILFGGSSTQVLWGVLCFIMIFVMLFAPDADFSRFYLGDDSPKANGKIVDIQKTGTKINKRYVYRVSYTFFVNDSLYSGKSYTEEQYISEKDIIIEYLRKKPSYSRVKGMRQKNFPPYVILICLIPVILLLILIFGLKKAINAIHLLKNGEISYGKMLHSEATNITVNKHTVWKMVFEFEDKNGKTHKVKISSHLPEIGDEAQELLFYDPQKPQNAVLQDDLPAKVKLKSNGKFKEASFFMALAYLILPIVAIIMLYFAFLMF